MSVINACKNWYVCDVDPRSEASVSTESMMIFNGAAGAAQLLALTGENTGSQGITSFGDFQNCVSWIIKGTSISRYVASIV